MTHVTPDHVALGLHGSPLFQLVEDDHCAPPVESYRSTNAAICAGHVLPAVTTPVPGSAGHVTEVPSHVSGTSQPPAAAARHSVPLALTVSAGHVTEVPSHDSAASQPPGTATRHTWMEPAPHTPHSAAAAGDWLALPSQALHCLVAESRKKPEPEAHAVQTVEDPDPVQEEHGATGVQVWLLGLGLGLELGDFFLGDPTLQPWWLPLFSETTR